VEGQLVAENALGNVLRDATKPNGTSAGTSKSSRATFSPLT